MRGERKARALLRLMAAAGLSPDVAVREDGRKGFDFRPPLSPDQREALVTVTLFSVGFPVCYRTAVVIFEAEGLPR